MEVGKQEGEFSFNGNARSKAVTILSSLQGARQMARVHGFELLNDVIGQIRQDLGLSA